VQVVEPFAGVATTIPAGSVSVTANPVAAMVLAVLSMVKVIVLTPPVPTTIGAKALVKVGGPSTVSVADAVPLLPLEEVRSPLVLRKAPTAVAAMSTDTVQAAPAPTLPPARETVPEPG